MRTKEQCHRMAFEEAMVRQKFPGFEVYDRQGTPFYVGRLTGPGFRNWYELTLRLLPGHPEEGPPSLLVTAPAVLPLYGNRGTLNALGSSADYHVFKNDGGPVKICFTHGWTPSGTAVMCLWRGSLWVTAYELHLATGQTIAEIIAAWKEKLDHYGRLGQGG